MQCISHLFISTAKQNQRKLMETPHSVLNAAVQYWRIALSVLTSFAESIIFNSVYV